MSIKIRPLLCWRRSFILYIQNHLLQKTLFILANSLRKSEYLPQNHSGSPYRQYTVKTEANTSVVPNTFYFFIINYSENDSDTMIPLPYFIHMKTVPFSFFFLPFSIIFCVFHLQRFLHNIFLLLLIAELTRANLMPAILCPVPQWISSIGW